MRVMYMPNYTNTVLRGFTVIRTTEGPIVCVVDPELDMAEPTVNDVEIEELDTARLTRCLVHAKRKINDKTWDAMRKEAAQVHGLSEIPDSKFFNND